jgi:hypothetical protein
MSDEQHRDDETEAEGHLRRVGASDEPANDDEETEESEVEAHIKYSNVRMD